MSFVDLGRYSAFCYRSIPSLLLSSKGKRKGPFPPRRDVESRGEERLPSRKLRGREIYKLLRQVCLLCGDRPAEVDARSVVVRPTGDKEALEDLQWLLWGNRIMRSLGQAISIRWENPVLPLEFICLIQLHTAMDRHLPYKRVVRDVG